MEKKIAKIFVDGDSCPVVNEILATAVNYSVTVVFVSSYAHIRKENFPSFVKRLYVDQDREAADLKIANLTSSGDIAVTDDLGLSSLLLAKGVRILNSRGKWITDGNIDYLLDARHQSAKRRRAGGKSKGPKKLTELDRQHFQKELEKILSDRQEF